MSQQVERLGVAVQGEGNVSTVHVRAYARNSHREVVSVASRTLEGAERKVREVGLNLNRVKLYDDYDALSIFTPPERHAREASRGVRAGKHLLIEKSVATEPGGLAEMAAAVRAAGVRTVVSFVLRRNPHVFNIDLFGGPGAIRGNRFFSKKLPGAIGFAEIPTVLPDSGAVSHDPFAQENDHFVDCVRSGRESHVNLADAVDTHEACFAADRLAARGGAPMSHAGNIPA